MTLADRIKGMIIGGIIGDGLGTEIEYRTKKEILAKYQNPKNYISSFDSTKNARISDETILISHMLPYFSTNTQNYEEHIGELHKLGDEWMRNRGFSQKMRCLIQQYCRSEAPGKYANNRGTGFVPLVIPEAGCAKTREEMHSRLETLVPKTHANADMEWTHTYFDLLYSLLHQQGPIIPTAEKLKENPLLGTALCGNIEKITIVNGSSGEILPAAITLYYASMRDIKSMASIAVGQFEHADYDTIFFATGALIGASVGYDALPKEIINSVRAVEPYIQKADEFSRLFGQKHTHKETSTAQDIRKFVSMDFQSMMQERKRLFNLVPELAIQEGYDSKQPRHCYSLLEHTLHTVDSIPKEDIITRTAALLHDVAKPYTREDVNSHATYHNHAKTGARMGHEILSRLGFDNQETALITQLIDEHVINYTSLWSTKAVRRFCRKNKEILPRLFTLAEADNQAQLPGKGTLVELKQRMIE